MTIGEALDQAGREAARGTVTLPPDLDGFPGVAHGGAVGALFHRLTLPRPPVRLRWDLLRGVPTGAPLRLVTGSAGPEARLALHQGDRPLAEATLSREPPAEPHPDLPRRLWADRGAPEGEVPATRTCLACGTENPLGLGVRFAFNARRVFCEHQPHETYRARRGFAHPALATVLLDELGWWTGALAQAECGVTTEITVTLWGDLPFAPLLALGDREAAAPDGDPRGRYLRASGWLLSPDGDLLATGTVRFAGSRAYTRRLLAPFLETTDLPTLRRFFPSAADLAR